MKKLCFIAILSLASCQSQQVINYKATNLSTVGPVAIDVQSFSGNIKIISDPTVVGTVVTAMQLEENLDETSLSSAKMRCTTEIETGTTGQIVHIVATCDDNKLNLISADIVIRANSIHGVSVITTDGDVTLLGVSGAISIQTSDGDVRVATPLAMNNAVTIENRRGNIVYRVRGESSGIIDATAINGNASLDLRHGKATILPGSTGDHLVACFNDGTNPITLLTVEGNIRIHVVPNPIGSKPLFSTDWITW